MTWHKTDDEFFDSAKLLPLEDDWRLWSDCIALWLAAGVFCSRSGTDGHIKRTRIARLTPMPEERAFEVAETLVELARKPGSEFGLWERNGDDYLFHDWLDYQPSAAEVAEKKAQNLKRQHRHRQQKRDGASRNALRNSDDYGYVTNESDDSEAVTNAVSHSPPSPTRSRSPAVSTSTSDTDVPGWLARIMSAIRCAWARASADRRVAIRTSFIGDPERLSEHSQGIAVSFRRARVGDGPMKDPTDHRVSQLMHDGLRIGCIREPPCKSTHLFIHRMLGTVDDGGDHHPDSIGRVEAGPCRGCLFGDELLQIGSGSALDR